MAAGGDQADVFGHRRVRRAGPLAVDDLVEGVGVADIGRLHRDPHCWLTGRAGLARPPESRPNPARGGRLRKAAGKPNRRQRRPRWIYKYRTNWYSITPCRSEEQTSELQSLMRTSYAVFRLNKKNKTNHNHKKPYSS